MRSGVTVRIGIGSMALGVVAAAGAATPLVAILSARRRREVVTWSAGGGIAGVGAAVAMARLGAGLVRRVPLLRSSDRGPIAIGLGVGAVMTAAIGATMLHVSRPLSLAEVGVGFGGDSRNRPTDVVYRGDPELRDAFDRIVDRLCESSTGRAIWERFRREADTGVGVLPDADYEAEPGVPAWSAGVFVPARDVILLRASAVADSDLGAAILAHEVVHAIDAAEGRSVADTGTAESRAYAVEEIVGRELGLLAASGLGSDGLMHRLRTLDEIEAALAADSRYRD